jgi:hypothetical protein
MFRKTAKNLSLMSVELLYLLYMFITIEPRFCVMCIFVLKTDIVVTEPC